MTLGRRRLLVGTACAVPAAYALGAKSPPAPTPTLEAIVPIMPQRFGAFGDGKSHPLSSKYSSLALAKVDYPFAQALTDEIDGCAFQAAMNYFLTQNNSTVQNWSGGTLYVPPGTYRFSRQVISHVFNLRIYGDKAGQPELVDNATKLVWVGAPGTIDDPLYLIKNYTIDPATGLPPVGVLPQPRGTKFEISGLGFEGMSAISDRAPGYVSAVFVGIGGHTKITDCSFGVVYDGIFLGGQQLFVSIERNFFYGCYRDCVSVPQVRGDFTTCVWIRSNEFGYYGRYAILLLSQGVQARNIIADNDFEGQSSLSEYFQNKSAFMQGIDADVCLMTLSGAFENNRFETDTYRHNVHLVNDSQSTFTANTFSGPVDSAAFAMSVAFDNATPAYKAYIQSHGYGDLTSQRNFTFDDQHAGNDAQSFYSNVMPWIWVYKYGAAAFNVHTGFSVVMQTQTRIVNVPVVDGTITQDWQGRKEQTGMYYAPLVAMNYDRGWLYGCLETMKSDRNIGLGYETQDDYGGAKDVIAIGRSFDPPTTAPRTSTLLWTGQDGKLKGMGPNGVVGNVKFEPE